MAMCCCLGCSADLIAVSRLHCMELLLEVCAWVSSISFFLVLGNITYTHCVYAGADSNDVEVLPLLFFFDGPHLRSAPDFIDLKWMQPVDFWDIFYGST